MGYSNVSDLREAVGRRLEISKKNEYDQDYFNGLLDEIIAISTIKYPPQALEEEIGIVMDSIENDLKRNNLDLPTYLKVRQMDEAKYKEEVVTPIAVKRLQRGLVMRELARVEKIELDTKQLEAEFNLTLSQLSQTGSLKQMRSKWSNEEIANMVALESSQNVLNRQVLIRLKAIATGHGDDLPETIESVAEIATVSEDLTTTATEEPKQETTSQPEA
jgi:FKBP-type peptidyl-prolyl cis-trans isomerase (trigger factor)